MSIGNSIDVLIVISNYELNKANDQIIGESGIMAIVIYIIILLVKYGFCHGKEYIYMS